MRPVGDGVKRRAHDADVKGDGGDQITASPVSSIQAASIWAITPMNTVQLLNLCSHILIAGSKRKKSDDLALELVSSLCLVFFDDVRLKRAGSIARCIELKRPAALLVVLDVEPFLRLGV